MNVIALPAGTVWPWNSTSVVDVPRDGVAGGLEAQGFLDGVGDEGRDRSTRSARCSGC